MSDTRLRILIAPGAFKHSLGADQAARCIEEGLRQSGLDASYLHCPIADGGNGTLDAFCAASADAQRKTVRVLDPLGREITAEFALLDAETAIIEMAQASGIELLTNAQRDPMAASTFGTGQLMVAALDAGAKTLIMGLGGSATVDGGIGCMQALGVVFYDAGNKVIAQGAGGEALSRVARIDARSCDQRLQTTELIIACDVDNPVVGDAGSAEVFAPQKGADGAQVLVLAAGLKHFFGIVADDCGSDVRALAGAGAAGSIAGTLLAICGGRLAGGFELWQRYSHFEEKLAQTDMLITGEGRMDDQTIHGKGPMGAAIAARKQGLTTVALVGGLDISISDQELHRAGIDVVFPLCTQPMPLETAIAEAPRLLTAAACRLGYALQL